MSFLYPLFLIAGLSLAIPVLIHLFNLRRYKTVLFPHTRFLKNIQLRSQKQSQVRYKLLLTFRMLFLAALILAFAQPFFGGSSKKETGNKLQVLYIDNSGSMSLKKSARSLLEISKESARRQVRQAVPGTRFLLLTNDKPVSYQPLPADKILTELNNIDITSNTKTSSQVFTTVQNLLQTEAAGGADLYYYSDFQRNAFAITQDKALLNNISFYGVPVQAERTRNVYIDTAYLGSPVLQTGQGNQLIVHSRATGDLPDEEPVLQLSINGQVKSAAQLTFNDKKESVDTLSFQVNDTRWQQITLTINDAAVRFDDVFRIAARSAPNLSVLTLNEGQANPYIQAAFRAYPGFRLNQLPVTQPPTDLREYNLVILNNVTRIDDNLGKVLANALQQGQTICIFPGRTNSLGAFNGGLKQIGEISFESVDTASQTVSSLQQGSPLVRDLFERIPENVQLPVANWHYTINAGLSANQQSILSFRNGDPFLARYTPSQGQLYICATSADLQSGNFPGSYFFVPFLYQMAMQSRGGDVYALTAGRQQSAFLPLSDASERNMVHIYGEGLDAIPPQRASGGGVEVYVDQVAQQPGFYTLAAAGADSAMIGLNQDRTESVLETWNLRGLRNEWKGDNIHWLNSDNIGAAGSGSAFGSFPLWKVCVILALLMLVAETVLLAGGFRKQNAATQ